VGFSFSRFYSGTYYADNGTLYKNAGVYNLYKDNNIFGQYFHYGSKHLYTFTDNRIKVVSIAKWYKKPDFKIINEQTNEIIGSFIIPTYYNDTYYHYPEVPYSNPYMKVVLYDAEYTFKRERPKVEYSLFNAHTWGYYAFSLYNMHGISLATYTLKVEKPLLNGSISAYSNIEGNIRTTESNIHLLFAGFFLIEQLVDSRAGNV